MSAGRICSRVVVTALPGELVRVAARRMAEHDVGTLVVIKDKVSREAIGIVTDRDIAIRCVADGLDPDQSLVSTIMTTPARAIDEDMPIEHAITRMAEAKARRLIVTGKESDLVGILSLDDVLSLLADEVSPIGRLLESQEPHVHA
ncbi:MAG TPA: CBS domain-containing protein [Gemmatimonadales bacterium]|nr:CBS domain-containing protein [Gemmatimonadales bacterium]